MLSFFPRDVLDDISNLIEPVSEGFPTYSFSCHLTKAKTNAQGKFYVIKRLITGGFLLLRNFSVAISVSPHVCFILVLILISIFLRKCIYELGIFHANRTTMCLRNQGRTKGEGWSTAN